MSRRTTLLLAFAPVLLLLAGAAAYVAWGAVQRARYHTRLEALRAAGRSVAWADLFVPPTPDAENGAAVLLQADALREEIERGAEGREGWDDAPLPPSDVEDLGAFVDRQMAIEELERLAPYRRRLDDVLAYPVLELETDGPFGDDLTTAVWHAFDHWELQAWMDPAQRVPVLDRMFGLLSRWRPRSSTRALTTLRWRGVLSRIQEGLLDGTFADVEVGPRWDAILRAEASDLVPALRHARRVWPACLAWFVGTTAEGRNPYGPLVRGLESDGSDIPATGDEEVDRLWRGLDRWSEGLKTLPWYARWWGRPFLWRMARRELEAYDRLWATDWSTVGAVRAWLRAVREEPGSSTAPHPANDVRTWLHHAASLELARLALAVHDHVREQGRLPATLGVVADRLEGGLPEDPLTGEAFHYALEDGEAVLQTDPEGDLLRFVLREPDASAADLRDRVAETALRWRVPAP